MITVLTVIYGVLPHQGGSAENPENSNNNKILLITSDYGSVGRCKTYEDILEVANTMISARPDIQVMDAANPDQCYYKSSAGYYRSGGNLGALYDAGQDPYGIMVDNLKNAGITVLAGIRVNDHQGAYVPWAEEHREWSLGHDLGDRGYKNVGRLRQMDYAIEGVREHRLAIIKEIISKYNVDGIQLDFGRTPPYLSEPKREKAKFMTQFIRDVRKVLDKASGKGKRKQLILGVILPWDLDFCEYHGLEIKRWIREGLVSHVSPGEWYYSDWNIPLDGWVKLTEGTDCKLYPMTCGNVAPYGQANVGSPVPWERGEQTLLGDNWVLDGLKISSLAETFYSQGADGFMLYNFYVIGGGTDISFGNYYPFIRDWADPAKIPFMSRHYFYCRRLKYVPTEHYTFGDDGYLPHEIEAFTRFPLDKIGDEIIYRFRFGAELNESTAKLRFKMKNAFEADKVSVTINGLNIEPAKIRRLERNPEMGDSYKVAVWETPITTPPLKQGENEIRVKLLMNDPARHVKIDEGRPGRHVKVEVCEFEIFIEPAVKD